MSSFIFCFFKLICFPFCSFTNWLYVWNSLWWQTDTWMCLIYFQHHCVALTKYKEGRTRFTTNTKERERERDSLEEVKSFLSWAIVATVVTVSEQRCFMTLLVTVESLDVMLFLMFIYCITDVKLKRLLTQKVKPELIHRFYYFLFLLISLKCFKDHKYFF